MKWIFTVFLSFGFWFLVSGQDIVVSGFITDKKSGQKLQQANIFDIQSGRGTASDNTGNFNIPLQLGEHSLTISYVGYQSMQIKLNLVADTTLTVELEANNELNEIEVSANTINSEFDNAQMSAFTMPVKKVYLLPSFFGESDIVKSFQLTPGVQSGNDGSQGLYVRGGGPDQNLVLLDGVPLYNINHMFGLYSVFNTDAVGSARLYKGGFPARYGGRLSSVLDIRLKDPDLYEYHGNISAGLIFSKFQLEGPIKKGKIGFNISARRTYADLIYKAAQKLDKSLKNNGMAYFYDVNAKITFKFSNKNQLNISSFLAVDDASATITNNFSLNNKQWEEYNKILMQWGNFVSSINWKHSFSEKWAMNTLLSYSNYNFDISHNYYLEDAGLHQANKFHFDYNSGIQEFIFSNNFNYHPSNVHFIKFGFNVTKQINSPGIKAVETQEGELVDDYEVIEEKIKPYKGYFYFEDDWTLSEKLRANIGFHISGYTTGQTNYSSFEPRISLKYMANDRLSLKASWVKMNQYIHLLSTATVRSPIDLWVPSTKRVKPEKSTQLALGTVYILPSSSELSLEGFYKKMDGVLEYKDGATFLGSAQGWEDKIEVGEGWSYGAELLYRKKVGKTTGWIGYTLSWSDRQYQHVNFGKRFPYRYDRRHDLNLVVMHKLSGNIDFGLTWIYGTGNAVTLPTQTYLAQNVPHSTDENLEVSYFKSRNNYRMPAYHRMDVSFNFHKEKKHGVRTWKIGLYNTYNNHNPFFLFFGYDDSNKVQVTGKNGEVYYNDKKVLKQFSLLPILPSISYSYKF